MSPSSPSGSASSTSSSIEMPIRTYGPRSVLVFAAVCLAIGYAFYLLQEKLKHTSHVTEVTQGKTQKVAADLRALKEQTEGITARLPKEQKELDLKIAELEKTHRSVSEQLRLLRQAAVGKQIERDRHAARLVHLRNQHAVIREELGALKSELTKWRTIHSNLMTSDSGKVIAANEQHLKLFAGLTAIDSVAERDITGWEEQLDTLTRSVPANHLDDLPGIDVSNECIEDLRTIAKEIRDALDHVRHDASVCRAILEEIAGVRPRSDAQELKHALAEFRNKMSLEREKRIQTAAESVAAKYERQLAEEKEKHEADLGERRLANERESARLLAELVDQHGAITATKIRNAVEDMVREEKQRQTEREAIVKKQIQEAKFQAALPDIKRYLAPFTAPGHWQLVGDKWVYSDQAVPISLGGIRAKQALKNNQRGYQQIYWIAGSQSNERPNGAFRQYIGGAIHEPEIPMVRKVQTLLIEFGDLMVEKGMLAP